ncbi:MAG: ribosomal protein S18-alanine N-acetyltransferase, partial [Clostridia bacterium]|nr:ribosomal protein S18-alanine N-acetyltransferase [Clostridia bacterium]
RKDLENKNAVYVCLEEDGKVIGYVGMWNISGEGNINNVAVLPDYRRKGYGRLLLSHLISYAKEHQLLLLTLEVRASNEGAIHLYESCGFEVVGRRKKYYDNCEDAILMTLPF